MSKTPLSKCVLFAMAMLGSISLVKAQNQRLEAIYSAGTLVKNNNYQAAWTIGEPISKTIGNQTHFVTQGFHQMQWKVLAEWDYIPLQLNVKLYPNPVSTDLNVEFIGVENLNQRYKVQIFDMLYKQVYEAPIESDLSNYNLSDLRNGTYVFHISDESGRYLKTFRIIKNL